MDNFTILPNEDADNPEDSGKRNNDLVEFLASKVHRAYIPRFETFIGSIENLFKTTPLSKPGEDETVVSISFKSGEVRKINKVDMTECSNTVIDFEELFKTKTVILSLEIGFSIGTDEELKKQIHESLKQLSNKNGSSFAVPHQGQFLRRYEFTFNLQSGGLS